MELVNSRNVSGIVRRTLGFVDERLMQHGERVAYIVLKMLQEAGGYTKQEIRNFCLIAMIHDIGAYKTEEIDNMVCFETDEIWNHSVYGYLFIKYLSFFPELASAILYHHMDWNQLQNLKDVNENLAQMIFVADRADIIWGQEEKDKGALFLEKFRGTKFSPQVLDLFYKTGKKSDLYEERKSSKHLEELLAVFHQVPLSDKQVDKTLSMLVSAIDFRSHYTVIHTITTTTISLSLGRLMGIEEKELPYIRYGSMLHDLGKVGVPVGILEYPGKLNEKEMEIMRGHVNITEKILGGEVDETVTKIALRHHEKLNGSGYPRGLTEEDLSLPEKIVVIGDIISALCGRRSYKEAYDKEKTITIIKEQVEAGLICRETAEVAILYFDEIMKKTKQETQPYLELYYMIGEEYKDLMEQLCR